MWDYLPFEPVFLLPVCWCLLMVFVTVGWLIVQHNQSYDSLGEYHFDQVQQRFVFVPELPLDSECHAPASLDNYDLPSVARSFVRSDQIDGSTLSASVRNGSPITVTVSSSGSRTISTRSASSYNGLAGTDEEIDATIRPSSSASSSSSGCGSMGMASAGSGSGSQDEELASAKVAGSDKKTSSSCQTASSGRLRLVRRIGKRCSRRPKRRDNQCVPSYQMIQITLRDRLQATFNFLNISFVDMYVQLSSKPPTLGGLLLAGAQFGYFVLMYGTVSLVLMFNQSSHTRMSRRGKSEPRRLEVVHELDELD